MFSAESSLHLPTGKMQPPNLSGIPGAQQDGARSSNPFSGIRRAGQAKRAMNFEKFAQKDSVPPTSGPFSPGARSQTMGGQAGTLFGNMRQNKANF